MGLLDQLREAIAALQHCEPPPALIGGLALAAHQVPRATRDIDLLVAAEDADRIDTALRDLGYTCVHRSDDAANYLRGREGLDLLYARRPIARRLLQDASQGAEARVVSVEGLIGFKLQALANAPERLQDLLDIRALVARHRDRLDRAELRGYFDLFDRQPLWQELFDER
jgi:hypothetical protein